MDSSLIGRVNRLQNAYSLRRCRLSVSSPFSMGLPPYSRRRRRPGIVTRRPLVLQLCMTEPGVDDYAEFLHFPKKRFTDFSMVRKEIQDETDKMTGTRRHVSPNPIHLTIYSPNVVNLSLIDLPCLTKVAIEGQPDGIVRDIENMVRSYISKKRSDSTTLNVNESLLVMDTISPDKASKPGKGKSFLKACLQNSFRERSISIA